MLTRADFFSWLLDLDDLRLFFSALFDRLLLFELLLLPLFPGLFEALLLLLFFGLFPLLFLGLFPLLFPLLGLLLFEAAGLSLFLLDWDLDLDFESFDFDFPFLDFDLLVFRLFDLFKNLEPSSTVAAIVLVR